MNLSSKIIIGIFAWAVIALSLSAYFGNKLTESVIEETISENQLHLAQTTMSYIDEKMFGRYADIQDYANSFTMEEYILGQANHKEAQQRLDSFLQASQGIWEVISLVDARTDTFILSTYKGEEGEEVDEDPENEKAYKAALSGKVFVSDILHSEEIGDHTVVYAAPIWSKKEASQPIIGAVIGHLSWSVIEKILVQAGDENRHVHLFDKNERMIATNAGHEYLFSEINQGFFENEMPEGVALSKVLQNNEHTEESLVSQAPQLGHKDYAGSNWELIIETPTRIAFAPSVALNTKMSLLMSFIFLFAIILILLIGRKLVIRPVAELSETAQAIAGGDFGRRAEVKSNDEIGRLAESFNVMTEKILESEKYTRGLIEANLDFLVTISKEGKITDVNEGTIKITGVSREKLIGSDFINYFTEPEKAREGYKEVLAKGKVRDYPLILSNKNGTLTPVLYNASVYRNTKGEIEGVFAAARDMTEVKKYAAGRLAEITPVLQRVATGDFTDNIAIPDKEDEFTEHMIALNFMIDDFKEMVREIKQKSEEMEAQNEELEEASAELEEAKSGLETKVAERTAELEKAKTGLEKKVAERTSELFKLNQNLEAEVQKRTIELQEKLNELKKFNKVAVGRELRMIELKEEIDRLKGVGAIKH